MTHQSENEFRGGFKRSFFARAGGDYEGYAQPRSHFGEGDMAGWR